MKEYTRPTINYYDRIAVDYAMGEAGVVLPDKINRFTGLLREGNKILDVACGPGHDTDYLSKRGFYCLGIDLSGKMIELARRRSKSGLAMMDFFNLAFTEESFDGIWCSSVFVHVIKKDLPPLLTSFRKILRDNGVLGIITAQKQRRERDENDSRQYSMYDKEELEGYLNNGGFEILVSETFPYGGRERLFLICKKQKIKNE